MKYTTYRNLGIKEMKKRLILASNYWNNKLLSETCKKISAKYCLWFYKRKKVIDFLIKEYAWTWKLIITK